MRRLRRLAAVLVPLLAQLAASAARAEDATDEVRVLTPIVTAIEQGRVDQARRPLQRTCGNRISRRCQYVWARYYELQGESFAALSAYDQFLRLARAEPEQDDKLRRQIDDARQHRLDLSQRLQPVASPDSVEGMFDSMLTPPSPEGASPRRPSEPAAAPTTSVAPAPPNSTPPSPAPAQPEPGSRPAKLQIDTDISGVAAQGLDGYPDGITLDRGTTVIQQPEGTRYVSFHLPGGYQVQYRDLKLRAGEKYPLEVLWRPQLQGNFPALQQESAWQKFVTHRHSPARYGYKIDRGDIIALSASSLIMLTGAILAGVIFSRPVPNNETLANQDAARQEIALQGAFLGAVPLFAGIIGTGVSLSSIFSQIPRATMPLPGRDLFGRALPIDREIVHSDPR